MFLLGHSKRNPPCTLRIAQTIDCSHVSLFLARRYYMCWLDNPRHFWKRLIILTHINPASGLGLVPKLPSFWPVTYAKIKNRKRATLLMVQALSGAFDSQLCYPVKSGSKGCCYSLVLFLFGRYVLEAGTARVLLLGNCATGCHRAGSWVGGCFDIWLYLRLQKLLLWEGKPFYQVGFRYQLSWRGVILPWLSIIWSHQG